MYPSLSLSRVRPTQNYQHNSQPIAYNGNSGERRSLTETQPPATNEATNEPTDDQLWGGESLCKFRVNTRETSTTFGVALPTSITRQIHRYKYYNAAHNNMCWSWILGLVYCTLAAHSLAGIIVNMLSAKM